MAVVPDLCRCRYKYRYLGTYTTCSALAFFPHPLPCQLPALDSATTRQPASLYITVCKSTAADDPPHPPSFGRSIPSSAGKFSTDQATRTECGVRITKYGVWSTWMLPHVLWTCQVGSPPRSNLRQYVCSKQRLSPINDATWRGNMARTMKCVVHQKSFKHGADPPTFCAALGKLCVSPPCPAWVLWSS